MGGTAMDCARAKPLFFRDLDGRIAPRDREDLYVHLKECRTCRAEYRDYRNDHLMLSDAYKEGTPTDDFWIKFGPKLKTASTQIAAVRAAAPPPARLRLEGPVLIAALVGTLVAGLVLGWLLL